VIIGPQHTCGGDLPPAAERRRFDVVQRQGLTDEKKAPAVVDAQLCGALRQRAIGLARD
jgi:hypothetical protein